MCDNYNKTYMELQHPYIISTCQQICYQRISVKAASTIWQRIMKANSKEELERSGIGKSKYDTINRIIDVDMTKIGSFDDYLKEAEKIKGIGPWTIKWLKQKHKPNESEFIHEDLEVRKGLAKFLGVKEITMEQAKLFGEALNNHEKSYYNQFLIQYNRENC